MNTFHNIVKMAWAGIIVSAITAALIADVGFEYFYVTLSIWAATKVLTEAITAFYTLSNHARVIQHKPPPPDPSEESMAWIKHNTFDNW